LCLSKDFLIFSTGSMEDQLAKSEISSFSSSSAGFFLKKKVKEEEEEKVKEEKEEEKEESVGIEKKKNE